MPIFYNKFKQKKKEVSQTLFVSLHLGMFRRNRLRAIAISALTWL
ncbi:MAG: hypothetical protein QNJ63_06255 [Calothrix sp. MO_192.B10]|nr:hypothetical protein [Calothrix sp. MO_192.B10]